MLKRLFCLGAALALVAHAGPVAFAAEAECDRECLRGLLTQYLKALVAHNPRPLPLAASAKFTEDGVEMRLGEGLWQSASHLTPYRLDFLDVRQGAAGTHVVIDESGSPVMLALRLKIVDRKIAEVETMVVRNQKEGVFFDIDKLQTPSTAMTIAPDRTRLNSRDDMIRIAERYPAGLKAGSFVTADVPFAPEAYRFENGRLMAGPACTRMPGCDNIKTQRFPTLSGLTYRVGLIDEELGIVCLQQNFGPGSIPGSSDDVLLVWELFKVYGGQIHAGEAFMERRPAGAISIWDTAAVRAAAEQVAPKAPGFVVPRTPWGDPDLNGIWPSIDMVRVPVSRSPQYGNRLFMSADEHDVLEKQEQTRIVQMANEGAGGATGAPGWWVEWGKSPRQTSLIVDPPDGRMPPLTAEGQARGAAAPRGTMGAAPLNGPEDFRMWERCLSRGALGSTLPVLYNSGIDITQGPGVVAIRYEMVHDQRIIPIDGRPHLAPSITQYMGDARGHWEGDTLVVETTNFTDRIGVGLSGGGAPNSLSMRMVERFTRVGRDTIRYEATVVDPYTWTAPWTVAFPLTQMPDYGMFEYACHEGNYGLRNALSASRASEPRPTAEPAAQQSPAAAPAPALWTVTEGMDSPESSHFDSVSGFIYVSQIGGQAADRDGNGRISKLTVDGKVVAADWVTGLNAPKGLRAKGGVLYAADLDEIVAIDIASGRITSRVKVDIGGAGKFFNDLDVAPDGTVYTSDSFGNRIFAIKDGQSSVFFEGDAILLPNGVLVDGDRLIVASDGRPARGGGGTPARLVAIDFRTKAVSDVAKAPIGTPDGVEKDGKGGFILSDVGAGRILQVTSRGEVRMVRQLAPQAADIGLIPDRGLLIVPHLGLNRVSAYDLSDVLK